MNRCKGEGYGQCKRCEEKGIWNQTWMCFLYKIEGHEGCYCLNCAREIENEDKGENNVKV